MPDTDFEVMFVGKANMRVTKHSDGRMWFEAWVPMEGASEGRRWLGYTGPVSLPSYGYASIDSFDAEASL